MYLKQTKKITVCPSSVLRKFAASSMLWVTHNSSSDVPVLCSLLHKFQFASRSTDKSIG
jgi:hypothetical protein